MSTLQEKYEKELGILKDIDEDVIGLHSAILLKNIIGSLIAPMLNHEKLFGMFMDLLTAEFKAIGYSLVKDEVVKAPEKTEDESKGDADGSK